MTVHALFWHQFARVARPIADYALPPRCPACGVIVQDDHRFCLDCWSSIDFLGDPCCAQCGLPFEFAQDAESLCGACLADPPPVDRARAVLAYGDVAKTVALKLKYRRRVGLARLIATHMVRLVSAEGRENMMLMPVPLHRWRLWSRGFNQSALIAKALGKRMGIPVDVTGLMRIRHTPPLRGMTPKQREKTVRGSFAMRPEAVKQVRGRTIVLIDDVHTSGATAHACARVLRRAGAAQVHLLCWARVLADRDDGTGN